MISKILKELREARNLTQKELAKKSGCTERAIGSWEQGTREPNPTQRLKLCKALGVNESELFGAIPLQSSVPVQKIPVVSWTQAGKFSTIQDWQPVGVSDEYIYTDIKGKNVFALRVEGSSMIPEFEEGEIIIVDPNIDVNPNDYVIVADRQENKATFKQYKKYGNIVVLHPLNPRYKDIELDSDPRYVVVGVVVAKEKKYRR